MVREISIGSRPSDGREGDKDKKKRPTKKTWIKLLTFIIGVLKFVFLQEAAAQAELN